MGGRRVKIVVELFDILAVVSLVACNTKETFFQNRVLAIPQGQPKAETLVVIRDTSQTVFTPSVCAGPRMLVREMAPGVAVCRVVLANGGLRGRK
jgi:hypothetical protein